MAEQSNQLSYQAGEAAGHAQARKEEAVEKAHDAAGEAAGHAQATREVGSEKAHDAAGVAQAGAQVQQIAQGAAGAVKSAADAVKNATGLGGGN